MCRATEVPRHGPCRPWCVQTHWITSSAGRRLSPIASGTATEVRLFRHRLSKVKGSSVERSRLRRRGLLGLHQPLWQRRQRQMEKRWRLSLAWSHRSRQSVVRLRWGTTGSRLLRKDFSASHATLHLFLGKMCSSARDRGRALQNREVVCIRQKKITCPADRVRYGCSENAGRWRRRGRRRASDKWSNRRTGSKQVIREPNGKVSQYTQCLLYRV